MSTTKNARQDPKRPDPGATFQDRAIAAGIWWSTEFERVDDWTISDPRAKEAFDAAPDDCDEAALLRVVFCFAQPDDIVVLSLPQSSPFAMRMDKFVSLVESVPKARLIDSSEAWSHGLALFLVEPRSDEAVRFFEAPTPSAVSEQEQEALQEYILAAEQLRRIVDEDEPRIGAAGKITKRWAEARAAVSVARAAYEPSHGDYFPVRDDARGMSIRLLKGACLFHVLVARSGNWTRYDPPLDEDQWFVEIMHAPGAQERDIRECLYSYLFELSASAAIDLAQSHRVEWNDYFDDDRHLILPRTLRPLLAGKGIGDVTSLYNKAVVSADPDVIILYLTKVLEWIAETAGQLKAYHEIRAKLTSPRALAPDAMYVRELRELIGAQRDWAKDRELLKQAVVRCCDASELRSSAPPCTPLLRRLQDGAEDKEKTAALEEFALTLYATRNEIAHAKANYVITGRECPPHERSQLAKCMQRAAQQAIRWYASLPPDQRV